MVVHTGLRGVGALRLRSLPAMRVLTASNQVCPPAVIDVTFLDSNPTRAGAPALEVGRGARETTATVTILRAATRAHPMTVDHVLTAHLPRSDMTAPPRVVFTGSGPFTGTATYMAGNKIVGPLSARFRGLGTVHVLGTKPVPGSLRAVAS